MPIDQISGFDPQRLRPISQWMEAHVREGRLSGLAVQIARRGEVAFSEHAGYPHDSRSLKQFLKKKHLTLRPNWTIGSLTLPTASMAANPWSKLSHHQSSIRPGQVHLLRLNQKKLWEEQPRL